MTYTLKDQEKPRPLLPPVAVSVASFIVPGLGQVLSRCIQRGLLLFASFASITLMLGWRVNLLAHREPTALAMLRKAFQRRPFFADKYHRKIRSVHLSDAFYNSVLAFSCSIT